MEISDSNITRKALETFRKDNKEIDFLTFRDNKIIPTEIKYNVNEKEIKKFASLDKFSEYFDKEIKIIIYPLWTFIVFS